MANRRVEFSSKSSRSKLQKYGEKVLRKLKSPKSTRYKLHKYQSEAVLETHRKINKELETLQSESKKTPGSLKPFVIVAPTGSGKSGILVMLTYVLKPRRALIITPSRVIAEQLEKQLFVNINSNCFFETSGIETNRNKLEDRLEIPKVVTCADDIKNFYRLGNLVIVTAQRFGGQAQTSLVNRNNEVISNVEEFFRRFDLLILDEAHHYPAKTWEKIVTEFRKPGYEHKKIVFLTATPYRNDASGNEFFILGEGSKDRIAFEITRQEVEGKTIRKCEFRESRRSFTKEECIKDIFKILEQNHQVEKRFVPQAMVLVRTRIQAKNLVSYFNSIKKGCAVAILGGSSANESSSTKYSLGDFTNGRYEIGVTCGVGLEGYDNPRIILCVVLRKIHNGRILLSQFTGRCKRINRSLDGNEPDKSTGVVFSYQEFEIKKLWESLNYVAENDPVDDIMDLDSTKTKDHV